MKTIAKFLCSIFGHKIHVKTGTITERQECLRCEKVWVFATRPACGVGTSEAERVFSSTNADVLATAGEKTPTTKTNE